MLSLSKTNPQLISRVEQWLYVWTLVLLASLCFSTALMEISCVAILAGWVFLRVSGVKPPELDRKMLFTLLAYVFLSSISFFWSEFPKQSYRGVLKVLKGLLVFLAVTEALSAREKHQRATQILIFSFIFLGINGVWQYASGFDLTRRIPYEAASSGPRISASFRNYGLLACYLVSFLPLLPPALGKKAKPRQLWITSLAFTFGLLLLFWTRLRGAWIAFVAGAGFWIWNSKRRKIFLALVGLIVLTGVLVLPHSKIIHLDAEGKEQSLVERYYLWDRAVQVIKARPLTGTGINTYAVAHQKFDRHQNWRVKNYYAHNGYLQMAAETGLPSLGFFLAFLFFYFTGAFKTLRNSGEGPTKRTILGFLTGLINFLVLSVIDTPLHNPPSVMAFWFLAGWGMAFQASCRTD